VSTAVPGAVAEAEPSLSSRRRSTGSSVRRYDGGEAHALSAELGRPSHSHQSTMQRILILVLLVLIALLQLKLWGRDGVVKVRELEKAVATQREENERLKARNAALEAEVVNLKEGKEAIEERARSELGLIAEGESFYQVIDGDKTSSDESQAKQSLQRERDE
jgi:cell division protein FtsB